MCVNSFLSITILRGTYCYNSHSVGEEANPEGLSKFLKISGWSMKHEMGDVAKDETGKVGRAEAKS